MNRGRHIVRLEGNEYVGVPEFFENLDMAQSRLHHRFRGVPELFLKISSERSHVHSDANRRFSLYGQLNDLAGFLWIGDVAGIKTQLGDSGFDGGQGHTMIEVYVSDDRNRGAGD